MTRTIRLFLSSPSDVMTEQQTVVSLADEINDVVAFLAPQLDVKLEVFRYQDDVHPDVGRPQDVVNRQIPQDYDIHVGIMWKRCGTPTRDAPSGTVHEFREAMKRRETTGRPIIMFYFSDEPPAALPRTQEELSQMSEVLKFREELQHIALTMTYPDRSSFRERIRGSLLRAVADVMNRPVMARVETWDPEPPKPPVPGKIVELARTYDQVRAKMGSGPARTRSMTDIFGSMVAEAPAAIKLLESLKASEAAGERLAAIAILRAFPQEQQLDWLAERLNPDSETPFVGYQAATAIAQAVRSLPAQADDRLDAAIERAMTLAKRNANDPPRINMLEQARRQLLTKRKQSPT